MPEFAPPPLPQAQKEGINQVVKDSYQSPESISGEITQDMPKVQGLLQSKSGNTDFQKQLGGGINQDQLQAIYRRAEIPFQFEMGQMKVKAKHFAEKMAFQRKLNAAKLVSQEHQLNEKIRLMKYKAELARQAARAGVLGNILGIAGAAAGAAATGSPAGAMAGYYAGQGAGQAIGQGGF
jgi:hypothetical protein